MYLETRPPKHNKHDVGLWEDFIEEPQKPELNFSQWLAAEPQRQQAFDDLPSVDHDRVILLVEKATFQSMEDMVTFHIENASAWGLTRAEWFELRGLLGQMKSPERHHQKQKKLSESLRAHRDNPADSIELCGRYALATGDRSTIRQQCEQYDIALDEDGLRRMIDSDNHFAQFLGFFLCRDLDDASFQSFIRYAGETMTERFQKGEEHYFDVFEQEIGECEPSELCKISRDFGGLYPILRTLDDGGEPFYIQRAIMDFITDGVNMHREGVDRAEMEQSYILCLKSFVARELDSSLQPHSGEDDEIFFQKLEAEVPHYFHQKTTIDGEVIMDGWSQKEMTLGAQPEYLNDFVEPLQDFGDAHSVKFLSSFAAHFPRDTGNEIIDTLSRIDPARTSQYFIPLLRSSDEHQRDIAARVLLRLEFGPIAVANDGVEYLGNHYDLGPMNNDAYTAHRLTADGKIGVFDEQQHLIRYFPLEQMDGDAKRIIAKVMRLTPDLLFRATPSDSDATRRKREEALELFQREYFRFFESGFVQRTEVQFNNLSFAEQGQLMIAYQQSNPGEREHIIDFVHRYREDGFRAFLSMQFGDEHASTILNLGKFFQEQHFTDLGQKIFSEYANIVLESDRARFILEDIAGTTSDEETQASIFNIDDVIDGMLLRGKDLLVEMYDAVREKNNISSDDLESLVETMLAALRKETNRQRVVRGHFKRIAELLKTDNIDLRDYSHAQELLWRDLANDRGLYLRVLHVMGKLAPIPEIHWRVDRTPQEYERRFGFDVHQFFADRAPNNRKGVLLEFGPGSGVAKEHRRKTGIDQSYDDFSIADTLYYNPASVIEKLIDWEKMGTSFQDPVVRAMFCDFLYKTIVIERGQTDRNHFEYDVAAREQLIDDPNALKEQLRHIGEKEFARIDMVPDTIAARDAEGRVQYPYKLRADQQTTAWRAQQRAFAENPDAFLRSDVDVLDIYDEIPAFAPGIMVGDFQDVARLRNNQVDAALGVRSTVYKKNEEYIRFMETVAMKLSEDGVYIDDNIRDNDGWYYRIGEIFAAQQRLEERGVTDVKFWVILGPGFEREDYRRNAVPLGIVAARGADVSTDISARLASGFRIMPFGELARNRDYLKTLDASGHTLSERDRYAAGALSAGATAK